MRCTSLNQVALPLRIYYILIKCTCMSPFTKLQDHSTGKDTCGTQSVNKETQAWTRNSQFLIEFYVQAPQEVTLTHSGIILGYKDTYRYFDSLFVVWNSVFSAQIWIDPHCIAKVWRTLALQT